MIALLDYSQIVISSIVEYFSSAKESVSLNLVRHIALQNIQFYKSKLNLSLDDMVICCDGRNYWRKSHFPQYKQNRRIGQESSSFNWDQFFEFFNTIKSEMKTELPFKVIEVDGCEADDVIAVLSQLLCPSQEEIIIVSSDKDLLQIQNLCPKVKQWSPYHKKFINSTTNNYNLFEHIVRGDSGDGIPNIFSDDDVFVTKGKRSHPIRAKTIVEWEEKYGIQAPEQFCSDITTLKRFMRNRTLIDLRMIPEPNSQAIKEAWDQTSRPKVNSFNYLVKHRLTKILERGGF